MGSDQGGEKVRELIGPLTTVALVASSLAGRFVLQAWWGALTGPVLSAALMAVALTWKRDLAGDLVTAAGLGVAAGFAVASYYLFDSTLGGALIGVLAVLLATLVVLLISAVVSGHLSGRDRTVSAALAQDLLATMAEADRVRGKVFIELDGDWARHQSTRFYHTFPEWQWAHKASDAQTVIRIRSFQTNAGTYVAAGSSHYVHAARQMAEVHLIDRSSGKVSDRKVFSGPLPHEVPWASGPEAYSPASEVCGWLARLPFNFS